MVPGMTSDSSHQGSVCLWGKWRTYMPKSQPALASGRHHTSAPLGDLIEEEIKRIQKKHAKSTGAESE